MWWASKARIAEADEYKKDPTSQSGKFHDHLRRHLPIYNDTDHLYDLHIPTFTKKTVQKDKHRLSVAPPHEWFDDDVGNDGTMIFKLEEAKSQNNCRQGTGPTGTLSCSSICNLRRCVPYSHDDSVIGFWVVNMLTQGRYFVAAVRKKLLCQCGCRGWCTFFPLFEMLRWSCSVVAEGMRPSGRHDGKRVASKRCAARINVWSSTECPRCCALHQRRLE